MKNIKTFEVTINSLVHEIRNELTRLGIKVDRLSEPELDEIAIAWLQATIDSGYIGETLRGDITDNDKISEIIRMYK
jgi:hypothetical protein